MSAAPEMFLRRHPTWGPRVVLKDDRDAAKYGAVAFGPNWRPEVARIIQVAPGCAPMRAEIIRVTEGWRDIRSSPDDHEDFNAFDLTVEMPNGFRANTQEYNQMAWRMKAVLGPDYGYLVHGSGANEHIHFRFRRD